MLADGVRRAALVVLVALGLWTGLTGAAVEAAEIKVLSTVGMQPATVELFKSFEAATGHKILVTYGLAAVLENQCPRGSAGRRPGPDVGHDRRSGEERQGRRGHQGRRRPVRSRRGRQGGRAEARHQHA